MAMLEGLFERKLGPVAFQVTGIAKDLENLTRRVEHLDQIVLADEMRYEEEEEEDEDQEAINDQHADGLTVPAAPLAPGTLTAEPTPLEAAAVMPGQGYSLRTRVPKARGSPYS